MDVVDDFRRCACQSARERVNREQRIMATISKTFDWKGKAYEIEVTRSAYDTVIRVFTGGTALPITFRVSFDEARE